MKKIFLLILLVCIKQINAQVCFGSAISHPTFGTGTSPYAVTTADFNNDGKLDLATANSGTNNLSVLLGDGTGNFGANANYTVGTEPVSIVSADFNKDGNADLATANYFTNNVSVLLGNGSGSFAAAANYSIAGMTGPQSICIFDFNTDGNMDIAVAAGTTNNVSVFVNSGSGFLSFAGSIGLAASANPEGITSADFNGDGKPDLATANYGTNNLSVILNAGALVSWSVSSYSCGTNPQSVCAGDFNGDGHTDIAVTNNGSNNIMIFTNGGTGAFTLLATNPAGTNPYNITTADVNWDGILDLACANSGSDNVSVYIGNGNGTFAAGSLVPIGSTFGPTGICSGDFNTDGEMDLAVADNGTGIDLVSILLNQLPKVNISGTTTVCYSMSTVLTAAGATSYTWSANAGSATTSTVSVAPFVNTTYTVTGKNTGCTTSSKATVTVTVNSLPSLTVTATSNKVCPAASVSPAASTLTVSGANTYTWSTSQTTTSIAVTPTTSTVYSVTGTSSQGCQSIVHIQLAYTLRHQHRYR